MVSSYLVARNVLTRRIAEAKRAQELNSTFVASHTWAGSYLARPGRSSRPTVVRGFWTFDPNSFPALRYRGLAYQQKAMYREAIADFPEGCETFRQPDDTGASGSRLCVSGRKTEALENA